MAAQQQILTGNVQQQMVLQMDPQLMAENQAK